jgi:hypothetical protein
VSAGKKEFDPSDMTGWRRNKSRQARMLTIKVGLLNDGNRARQERVFP